MITAFIALAAAAATPPAPEPVSIADPKTLVPVLQSLGYQAKLDASGKVPSIDTAAAGWKFSIHFQNCKEGKDCEDLLFYAGWEAGEKKPTLEQVNEFNRDNRFGRAYIDKDQDAVIEMDVIFTDKLMSRKALEEHLDVWSMTLGTFAKHIGME